MIVTSRKSKPDAQKRRNPATEKIEYFVIHIFGYRMIYIYLCLIDLLQTHFQKNKEKLKIYKNFKKCSLKTYTLLRPPSSIPNPSWMYKSRLYAMKIWWIQFFGLMFTQLSPGVFKVDLTQVFVWNCVAAKHSWKCKFFWGLY